MCWITTSCIEVWRKPAVLYGLAVTDGRAAVINRIFRLVFGVTYAFSLLAGSGDFLKKDEDEPLSTCIRLFVFVHKAHTVYIAPAISLAEACLRPPPPPSVLLPIAAPKSHTAVKITLLVSALTSLAFEEITSKEHVTLRVCRLYLRFSSYTIMELYLERSRVLLVALAKLDENIDGDFDDGAHNGSATAAEDDDVATVIATSASSWSWSPVGKSDLTPTASRCSKLIVMKSRTRDSTRWLNRSFGAQLFVFYASTAVNLSCLAGELIIIVHRAPDLVWTIAPRFIECLASILLAVFMARLGSGVISLCLQAQYRIKADTRLADEVREVLAFRPEWDTLRIIDSAPHELSTIAGAVVNIVTFVAIVLQFDVTVTESVFSNGSCDGCKNMQCDCGSEREKI